MTKRQNIGWMLIYTAIISWTLNGFTGSVLAPYDIEVFDAMMAWAFGTLPVLLVGIVLAVRIPIEDKGS